MNKLSYKIIVLLIIIVVLFCGIILNKKEKHNLTTIVGNEAPVKGDVVVEIKGEVYKPGLYILDAESRVNDLVIIAGGFTDNADTTNLNLAAKLVDGIVIYVISKDNQQFVSDKISINTATIEELIQLPGIGESRARSIVDYRNHNGSFKSLEELTNVNGISDNILDQIKELISL